MKKAFDKVSHLLKEKFRNKNKEDGASRQFDFFFLSVIGRRFGFDLVTRKDALDFKETKEGEWSMLQDMTKSSGISVLGASFKTILKLKNMLK
ncbi:hypothetical protein WN944_027653 [Citrus x changshan-huyou]|uniref:Uncharacterized protein n=1 Tax=Citrus x changshan-huyou TaxID=2935761 RepID=A0AAP0LIC0_9ROSI